jgi:hypothetical protein
MILNTHVNEAMDFNSMNTLESHPADSALEPYTGESFLCQAETIDIVRELLKRLEMCYGVGILVEWIHPTTLLLLAGFSHPTSL